MQVINTPLPMISSALYQAERFYGNAGMVAKMFRLPRKTLRKTGKPLGYSHHRQNDWLNNK